MTHQEIESADIIDGYVRGTLDPSVREAFEEHFFACDACFASVREAEQLKAAVVQAAQSGMLPAATDHAPATRAFSLQTTLTTLSLAATVVLGVGLTWVMVRTVPRLQSELATAQADRDVLATQRTIAATVPSAPLAEANVPIVMLQSERAVSADVPTLSVPPGTPHVVVWMSAPPATSPVRVVVLGDDGHEVTHLDGVKRNGDGAYVVSLPAALVPPQTYRLRLLAGDGSTTSSTLIGEYLMRVVEPR